MVGRSIGGRRVAEKKRYLIEITYHETKKEEIVLETDDLVNESVSKKY